jgi:hypothetical protein
MTKPPVMKLEPVGALGALLALRLDACLPQRTRTILSELQAVKMAGAADSSPANKIGLYRMALAAAEQVIADLREQTPLAAAPDPPASTAANDLAELTAMPPLLKKIVAKFKDKIALCVMEMTRRDLQIEENVLHTVKELRTVQRGEPGVVLLSPEEATRRQVAAALDRLVRRQFTETADRINSCLQKDLSGQLQQAEAFAKKKGIPAGIKLRPRFAFSVPPLETPALAYRIDKIGFWSVIRANLQYIIGQLFTLSFIFTYVVGGGDFRLRAEFFKFSLPPALIITLGTTVFQYRRESRRRMSEGLEKGATYVQQETAKAAANHFKKTRDNFKAALAIHQANFEMALNQYCEIVEEMKAKAAPAPGPFSLPIAPAGSKTPYFKSTIKNLEANVIPPLRAYVADDGPAAPSLPPTPARGSLAPAAGIEMQVWLSSSVDGATPHDSVQNSGTSVYTVPVGRELHLCVKSNWSVYLIILNRESDGDAQVMFPNCYARDGFLLGGMTHVLPGAAFPVRWRPVAAGENRFELIAAKKPIWPDKRTATEAVLALGREEHRALQAEIRQKLAEAPEGEKIFREVRYRVVS